MNAGAFSIFRFNITKDIELLSSSPGDTTNGEGRTFTLECSPAAPPDAGGHSAEASLALGSWLDAHAKALTKLLGVLAPARVELLQARTVKELQAAMGAIRDRSVDDLRAALQLVADALLVTTRATPQDGQRLTVLTRAAQTLHAILQVENMGKQGQVDVGVFRKALFKVPLLPVSMDSPQPILATGKGGPRRAVLKSSLTREPLSYGMVTRALARVHSLSLDRLTVDTVAPQPVEGATPDARAAKPSVTAHANADMNPTAAPGTRVTLGKVLARTLPRPVTAALERLAGATAQEMPLVDLIEQLHRLKRRLYGMERRMVRAPLGRPFIAGEWRDLQRHGWSYVVQPQAAGGQTRVYVPMFNRLVVTPSDPTEPTDAEAKAEILDRDDSGAIDKDSMHVVDRSKPPFQSLVSPSLRVLGVSDLLLVEQRRVRYEPSEVAHIENVLEGERFERTHRNFSRTEAFYEAETETSQEQERDLQSSEKFELEREVSQVMREEQKTEFGSRISASYGASVSVETEFGIESLTATEKAERSASRFASELTERSITRIRARQREVKRLTTVTEMEETSNHGIDRRGTPGNLSGVYQWVDKVYELQIVNYGKRLMLEVMIPEPGVYLRHLRSQPGRGGGPTPPEPFSITPEDVTEDTYGDFAAAWKAVEISPPPQPVVLVGHSAKPRVSAKGQVHHTGSIKLPDGYSLVGAHAVLHRGRENPQPNDDPVITVAGETARRINLGRYVCNAPALVVGNPTGEVAFSLGTCYAGGQVDDLPFTMTLFCRCTPELRAKWQLETYNALLQGYQRLKSEYDEAAASNKPNTITGAPPAVNRDDELVEIRKLCIELLQRDPMDAINCITWTADGTPHIDAAAADRLAGQLDFFEACFEWENLSYDLLPYYWAGSDHADLRLIEDPDPVHQAFLRAGAARVRIPVRPHCEKRVLHFIDFGGAISAAADPAISAAWAPVLAELAASTEDDIARSPRRVGKPWLARVPTTFVTLRSGSGLPPDWIPLAANADVTIYEDDAEEPVDE